MNRVVIVVMVLCLAPRCYGDDEPSRVNITPSVARAVVRHGELLVTITRRQDPSSTVNSIYARTSRDCPPFCVQPITLSPGVETIGELELLDYLQRITDGDNSVIVIDSRTPEWVKKGTIPGAINIPWTIISPTAGADPFEIADVLEAKFGAIAQEGLWNYSSAKTLILFCNGIWCEQSPTNIRALLQFGYPAHRIKWYRGGMQAWEGLGLTVVQ